MTDVLKHQFVSGKADGADATQVQPSNWNAGHKFSGGTNGYLLQRDTGDATFGAAWLAYAVGTWVPADGSGAGLVFNVVMANYIKIGRLVHVDAQIVYPVTASGANAKISGLPFTPSGRSALAVANCAVDIRLAITNGATVIDISSNVGAAKTNVQMTSANFYFSGTYISTT